MQYTVAIHVLIAATSLSLAVAVMNGTLFSWHPALMSLGFLGCMAEGVLTSITFRSLEGNERLRKIWVHLAWQAAALSCVIGGFAAIYQNKINNNKQHFQSVHAKAGLATFSLSIIAALGGVISFRRFGLVTRLPEKAQGQVKWVHRNVGLLVFLASLVVVELGLVHQAVWKGALTRFWQAGVAFLAAAFVGIWWVVPRDAFVKGTYETVKDETELTHRT